MGFDNDSHQRILWSSYIQSTVHQLIFRHIMFLKVEYRLTWVRKNQSPEYRKNGSILSLGYL